MHSNFVLIVVTTGRVIGRICVTGRRGKRGKQLLDDLEKTRGYWKIKEVAICEELASEDIMNLSQDRL
jgi:hypothetical protein